MESGHLARSKRELGDGELNVVDELSKVGREVVAGSALCAASSSMPGRRRKAAESSARRRRSSGRGGGGVGQVGGQRCWSSGGDDGSARLAGGLGARRGREEEKTRLWERTNGRQGPYVSEVETGAFWAIRNYNGLHVGPRIYRV
uniref:Uncharacterized protein n=1 Tax=Oryza rufipogon TaxID=4529 RepID=A0A0E0NFS0_ORYRU